MTSSSTRNSGKSIFRNWRSAIGWLLAAAGLIWVLHDIHLSKLAGQLAGINWRWVVLGLVCDMLSFVIQGVRWQLLLRPIGRINTLQATQAIYAGLFTNEVLPMRAGELVRSYLASRWIAVEFMAVVPSIVVERFFDGVWIAGGIGLAAMFAPLPEELVEAGDALGIIIALAVALFIFFAFRWPRRSERQPDYRLLNWKPARTLAALLTRLSAGVREMSRTKEFYLAFALSLLFLALQMFAFWLIMLGYGLRLSIWIGAAVFLIVILGTAIPNAPANVGSYQFFTVLGLTLFGVDKTAATGFSLVVFTLLTLPLLGIGFLAFSRSGMSLAAIREELRRPERRAGQQSTSPDQYRER